MNAGSLASILQKVETIPEKIIDMITIQLLRGLEYLHLERKIIYRDIKPQYILLTLNGTVKIADFGVTSTFRNSFKCMSNYPGTVSYLSPEQIMGLSYNQDIDIWSLGLLLIEAATGTFPYHNESDKGKLTF